MSLNRGSRRRNRLSFGVGNSEHVRERPKCRSKCVSERNMNIGLAGLVYGARYARDGRKYKVNANGYVHWVWAMGYVHWGFGA